MTPADLLSLLTPGAWVTSDVKSRRVRQQVDLFAADVGRLAALLDVDERRFGRDRHRLGDARELQS